MSRVENRKNCKSPQSAKHAFTAAFVALGLAAACGSGRSVTETEQSAGVCPSPPQTLTGTAVSGGNCLVETDCAPTCCTCANGDAHSFLAVDCAGTTCATAATTCSAATGPSVCP